MINCSSDLYTSELCCVLPTCNIISCNCLLHQCRRCKSRKHQTKLVLALSYMKQEVKMLNSFPWGQHLVQPICPWVCAGRTKHKMQSGGEAGESILVRKTTVENTMTSKVFWPTMELSLLKTMVLIHMFLWVFSVLAGQKKFFSFIKSWFANSFKFDITERKPERDNLKSSASSLLCNHTVVIGCCKNSKFFTF